MTVATPPRSDLRWLTDAYVQTQKLRIAIGNRIDAVDREVDEAPLTRSIGKLFLDLRDGERAIYADMKEALKDHPAWGWLQRVKGIGPTLATKLIGLIGDIGRYDTVAKLWRVSGYAVIDGKRERPVKGEKLHYSIRLKTTVYLCAESFLKSGSPYRTLYDNARTRYDQRQLTRPKEEQWTPKHCQLAAMRVMSKVFLSHLWETWREAEGLPVRKPYVQEYLGHTGIINPWDMVESK